MQQALKKHAPSEKGKELIAILFPLDHQAREKNIIDFWKHYPKEIGALIDGFHFIIQELVEARSMGENENRLDLPDELLLLILTGMRNTSVTFAYSSFEEFFSVVNAIKPEIFANPKRLNQLIEQSVASKPKHKSAYDLPSKLDDTAREKIKNTCEVAAKAYIKTQQSLPSILNARKQVDSVKQSPGKHAEMDFKLAKMTFQESYTNYETNAKIISKSWPLIHDAYLTYPDEPEIVQTYIRYLAKLLASRESRYPPENYVKHLADNTKGIDPSQFEPNDDQMKKGISSLALKKDYIASITNHVNALESRYRKRKLMVKLKEDTPKTVIIKELLELSHIDPIDIKTSILLARLFSEYARTIQDVQKRTSMKEQALRYCKLAYAKIDEYLDLQHIKKMSERDHQRAGFVKTITAIRLPLIKRK